MYRILTLNKIAQAGICRLPQERYQVSEEEKNPDGILVRSSNMHSMPLGDALLAVARAGAGTNNIPIDACSQKGIAVFNTPGANANAVKEMVITGLLLSSRKVVDGILWAKGLAGSEDVEKAVEKGKSAFVGPEIYGKKLGVIGLGAIGVLVANAAKSLGMEVLGFDPFLSVDAAWHLSRSVVRANSIQDVVSQCDYITVHVPLTDKTKGMFNDVVFSGMKPGMRLLNFARGGLVENTVLKRAIVQGIVSAYVTDFPSEELLQMENVIAMPHIGASTPESEENCAEMAALELKDYLEYGTIKNSVNFPDCELAYNGKGRISIAHQNIPNMVGSIATIFAQESLNIDNMLNKSKGKLAYTLIDVDDIMGKNESLIQQLAQVKGVYRARVVCDGQNR